MTPPEYRPETDQILEKGIVDLSDTKFLGYYSELLVLMKMTNNPEGKKYLSVEGLIEDLPDNKFSHILHRCHTGVIYNPEYIIEVYLKDVEENDKKVLEKVIRSQWRVKEDIDVVFRKTKFFKTETGKYLACAAAVGLLAIGLSVPLIRLYNKKSSNNIKVQHIEDELNIEGKIYSIEKNSEGKIILKEK